MTGTSKGGRVRLVWNEQYHDEDGDHCDVYIVDEDGINFDYEDLADHPGDWQTEDPYTDAEDALLTRNGFTRDDVAEIVTPW